MKLGKLLNKYIVCGALSLMVSFGQITLLDAKTSKDFTVVIDAGHGGHDYGAVDNGVNEKDINLGVAKKLAELIAKKMKDTEVIMTRKDDTFITLQQRADIANNAKGDLFISIHTNSVDKNNKNRKSVAGTSVYALGLHKDNQNMDVARRENSVIELESDFKQKYSGFDPNKDESYIIFEMAQKKNLGRSLKFANEAKKSIVANAGRKDRGVKQAGFWVLWATSMPAVLIELDFICNPECAKYMGSDSGQEELAEAIFKALETYKGDLVSTKVDEKSLKESEAKSSVKEVALVDKEAPKPSHSVSSHDNGSRSSNGNTTKKRRRRSEAAKNVSEESIVSSDSITVSRHQKSAIQEDIVFEDSPGGIKTIEDISDEPAAPAKKVSKKRAKKDKQHRTKRSRFVKVYKIQVLASPERLKQNNPGFCGLSPISAFMENNMYKYTYGESTDKGEIENLLKEVKKKIPDAFIISIEKEMQPDSKKK